MNRLHSAVLATLLGAAAMSSAFALETAVDRQPYTISLPSVSDRSLVGQRVDVYVRKLTLGQGMNDSEKVLANVPLVSAPADRREATLTLTAKEIRRLRKFEKVGQDLVLRSPVAQ